MNVDWMWVDAPCITITDNNKFEMNVIGKSCSYVKVERKKRDMPSLAKQKREIHKDLLTTLL